MDNFKMSTRWNKLQESVQYYGSMMSFRTHVLKNLYALYEANIMPPVAIKDFARYYFDDTYSDRSPSDYNNAKEIRRILASLTIFSSSQEDVCNLSADMSEKAIMEVLLNGTG